MPWKSNSSKDKSNKMENQKGLNCVCVVLNSHVQTWHTENKKNILKNQLPHVINCSFNLP